MLIRKACSTAAAIAVVHAYATGISIATEPERVSDVSEEVRTDTFAWVGCWRPVSLGAEDMSEEGTHLVFLEPGDESGSLKLRAIENGEVVTEELLLVDGNLRPVSTNGCRGWIRHLLSADQQRLYRQSETTCDGNRQSSLSGASLIVSGGTK